MTFRYSTFTLLFMLLCVSPLLAEHVVPLDDPSPFSDPSDAPVTSPFIDPSTEPAASISNFTPAFGALVVLPHLLSRDPERRETGLRVLDAGLIAGGLASLLKRTNVSPRPFPFQAEQHAFPSGHTAFAFAIAAALSEREPRAAYWAYPIAAAVGWSRYKLQKHTWAQIAGGAVLGTYVGMRAGKGQWHLFGHTDADLAAKIQAASAAILDKQVTLWSSSF
ncbi:MAG: phosphatase PAP2 family protein [Bacteroidota bacterium]